MQTKFILTLFIGFSLFFYACQANDEAAQENQIDVRNISAINMYNQQPSNEAKTHLSKHDEIIGIKAINTDKKMIIAIEIEHLKRFTLKEKQKKYTKEMEKMFKDFDVELSTDKKIFLELEKLEKKIQQHSITKKELKKEVDDVIKLSKEQT